MTSETLALKTAMRVLVDRLGGLEAAEACTRVGKTNLGYYASRHVVDRHVPVDVLLDLERVAGEPVVTAALARMQGFRLERVDGVSTGDVVAPVQRVTRDAGELAAQLMDALADQTITRAEADGLLATSQRIYQALGEAMAALAMRRGER